MFGFWAFVLLGFMAVNINSDAPAAYLDGLSFSEPAFVFCIMCMAATKPILDLTERAVSNLATSCSKLLRMNRNYTEYFSILAVGPILGSFITEPAAMTVCALLAKKYFSNPHSSQKFRYATIGLLFVNVSIGGVFTNFAAPPVLMVARQWNWSSSFMFTHFGWRSLISVMISTILTLAVFRKQIASTPAAPAAKNSSPLWLSMVHVLFMFLVVAFHTHLAFFVSIFLLFVGWTQVTQEHQNELKIRESLLVGFFLGGLVVLGGMQQWWLKTLLISASDNALFFGATALTAITDNAALTYLGSLVPNLADTTKFLLVAGAVTGGGLTVIANAPNPAGYGILREEFGDEGIRPLGLLFGAMPATLMAIVMFWLIP